MFWVTFAVALFYFCNINIEYKTSAYNVILIPPLILLLLAPLIHFKFKNEQFTGWYVFIALTIVVLVNIHVAGGFHASGIFWISVFPLLGGLIFSIRGVIVGTIVTVISFLFFLFTEPFWGVQTFDAIVANYQNEKILDVLLFTMTLIYFTYYFISTQIKFQKLIELQKNKVEGLLGILIHDIASPLTVIKLKATSAIENSSLSEKNLMMIQKQADHLALLIRGIREMKAVSDEKIKINFERCNLKDLLQDIIELYKERAADKKISVHLNMPDEPNIFISVDPQIFKSSIIGNLLTNAIKFSNENSNIEVNVYLGRPNVIIEIKDHGIGIPPELTQRLFIPNASTTRSGTAGEKGTGFGLLMVKQWTESMKGTIEVQSKVKPVSVAELELESDSGTSFRLSFTVTSNN